MEWSCSDWRGVRGKGGWIFEVQDFRLRMEVDFMAARSSQTT